MSDQPRPPKTYDDFVAAFPQLADAWRQMHDAGEKTRFDAKTTRLLKLAIAIGAQREGAVRASARKAAALGISEDEINEVVGLAASSVGFPATVAAFSWAKDALED